LQRASALRRVICGGEVDGRLDLLNRLLNRLAVEFINMYGPTETTSLPRTGMPSVQATTSSSGDPQAPIPLYVLDRDLNPTPPGLPGELYLGGDCLARGYSGTPRFDKGAIHQQSVLAKRQRASLSHRATAASFWRTGIWNF